MLRSAKRVSFLFHFLFPPLIGLLSDSLTWKWKMAPWKTTFLYKQVVFHFHVSESECIGLRSGECHPFGTLWFIASSFGLSDGDSVHHRSSPAEGSPWAS